MEKITAEGDNLIGYVMQKLQITFFLIFFLGVNFSGSLGRNLETGADHRRHLSAH